MHQRFEYLVHSLIKFSPFFLVAGILDYRFHQYFWRPLNILRPFGPPPMFDFWSVWDFALVALTILWLLSIISSRTQKQSKTPLALLPLFIVFIVITVSALSYNSVEPVIHSFWNQIWKNYAAPILFFTILLTSVRTEQMRKKFTDNLLWAFGALGALSLFEYATDLLPGARTDFLGRLVWPYIDPFVGMKPESANWLAYIFAPMLLLSVEKMLTEKNKLYGIFVTINAAVLLLTKSYAGIGVAFLLIAWRLFHFLQPRARKILLIAVLLIAIAGIASQYSSRKFQILLGNYTKENSLERRAQIYRFTWKAFQEKPLTGIGPGNYQNYFRKNMAPHATIIPEEEIPPHPHNLIAQFWSDLGLPGAAAIIGIYLWFAILLLKNSAGNIHTLPFIYLLGHGLIDAAYGLPEISTLFWILLWYTVTHTKINSRKK